MLRKLSLILLCLLLSGFIFSEDDFFYNRKFITGMFTKIEFNNGNIKYFEDSPNGYKIFFEGKFLLLKKDKFNILNINDKSYVAYYINDTIILHNINEKEIIIGTDKGNKGVSSEPHLYKFRNIKSNSYLIEGNIKFLASNLEDYDLSTPWVEGDKGDGIGSKLILETDIYDPTNIIVIANGYFDPKRLYLYEYNNRVRKIKIKSIDATSEFEIITDLKDTYNLQMIKLPMKTNKIEIVILEVYKGTKFNDTCIAGLFTSYWN